MNRYLVGALYAAAMPALICGADFAFFRSAALDDDPGIQPALHVHVASKAPWFTITDDLPQFPDAPK